VTFEAEALRVPAPAKINLFLHVGEKRPDGYHALQSLVAFTRMGDELALSPDRDLRLVIRGPFGKGLSEGEDNLVLRAGRALQARQGQSRGAYISLKKNLPVASGIGGGSADCAAALRGLSRLWNLKLTQDELRAVGATLGSDVPVCVSCRPQWMEGRGEILTQLPPLPEIPIVLINPGVPVPTGRVFAALNQRRGVDLPLPPVFASAGDVVAYLKDTSNDLEAPARSVAPIVSDVLALIARQGALLSRMSGSGATCFGLFETGEAAARAANVIAGLHPQWWSAATMLCAFSSSVLLG
jgi:4-diphosphocytidyl-2-C-methyl-D-erythritol kinase